MATHNRCRVKYGEGSLVSIRLPPLRCQPSPHACPACQPSTNRFVFAYSLQSGGDTPRTIRLPRNTVYPSLSAFTTSMPFLLRCTGQSTQTAIVERASVNNPKSIEDMNPNR
ncbi:unnamed protein product [Ascophyllum nodosum]